MPATYQSKVRTRSQKAAYLLMRCNTSLARQMILDQSIESSSVQLIVDRCTTRNSTELAYASVPTMHPPSNVNATSYTRCNRSSGLRAQYEPPSSQIHISSPRYPSCSPVLSMPMCPHLYMVNNPIFLIIANVEAVIIHVKLHGKRNSRQQGRIEL